MTMTMTMTIIIIFTRMQPLPSSLITCDWTIPKYKTITEEATKSCSQMFTVFWFSSDMVLLIHQSRFLWPSFRYRPQIEC